MTMENSLRGVRKGLTGGVDDDAGKPPCVQPCGPPSPQQAVKDPPPAQTQGPQRSMFDDFCHRTGRDPYQERESMRKAKEREERELDTYYRSMAKREEDFYRGEPAAAPPPPASTPPPSSPVLQPIEVIISHPLFEGIKTKSQLRQFLVELLMSDMVKIAVAVNSGDDTDGDDAGTEGEEGSTEAQEREEAERQINQREQNGRKKNERTRSDRAG